jgi:carbamoyl-phosphate synthase large subunit
MDRKKVLVTGVGGNVGQGIIRNIRNTSYNIEVIGTNVIGFSAGNHLCDKVYTTPFAYDAGYISAMNEIIEKERINLIIPSTDYEVYYLSQNRSLLQTALAASGADAASIYLDKYLSFLHHQKYNIAFAEACLPSVYQGQFQDIIAKPRKGRGSRGLHINPGTWNDFSDEEYMIQELHKGQEITTAFYVNKNRELHGSITLLRQLDNGATNQCKVVFEHDDQLIPILKDIILNADICGAANLQSIVTPTGQIFPFEINCRISGTNSIRSNFGFEDVKYTLQEYLYDMPADQPNVKNGVAVRILMDVIYPDQSDFLQTLDRSSDFYIY